MNDNNEHTEQTIKVSIVKGFIWIFLSSLLLLGFRKCLGTKTIINSFSPNKQLKIKWIRFPSNLDSDRQYHLEVFKWLHIPKTIFRSGNENNLYDTGRIIWSSDSSRFILVGTQFEVWASGKEVFLFTGEYIYLMYEIASDRLLCNTHVPEWCDVVPKRTYKPFPEILSYEPVITLDDLLQYEWESPLIEAHPISSPAKK